MLRINNTLINPNHIVYIDLDAQIYCFKDLKYHPGIVIYLAVTDGEFGTLHDNSGSWEPHKLEYRDEAADALRPWLRVNFGNEKFIDLPEPAPLVNEPPF